MTDNTNSLIMQSHVTKERPGSWALIRVFAVLLLLPHHMYAFFNLQKYQALVHPSRPNIKHVILVIKTIIPAIRQWQVSHRLRRHRCNVKDIISPFAPLVIIRSQPRIPPLLFPEPHQTTRCISPLENAACGRQYADPRL